MPLILPKEREHDWLDLEKDETHIKSIMIPYKPEDMKAYPVKNTTSRLGFNTNDQTIIEPFEYQNLPELNYIKHKILVPGGVRLFSKRIVLDYFKIRTYWLE